MKSTTIVAFLAGIAAVSAVPAPVDATVSAFAYPEGVTATVYADGLPASLVPRAIGLQKRSDASVYFCTDVGFNGYCVDINVNYYQCGEPLFAFVDGTRWRMMRRRRGASMLLI